MRMKKVSKPVDKHIGAQKNLIQIEYKNIQN